MKKFIPFLFSFFIILSAITSNAQQAQWIQEIGSSGFDSAEDIAIDANGNIYVTGNYSNNANFGNGIILTSAGSQDAYAAKYNSAGTLTGLIPIGGTLYDSASGITVDDQENTYVTGYATDNEGPNITIVKIDPNNDVSWTVSELILGGFGGGTDVAVDASGNVYISGSFSGTVYFNDGASTTTTLTTSDSRPDIFLAKYNSAGDFQWVKQAGGLGDDFGTGVAVTADGTTFMTGWFENSAYGFTSQGGEDAFVVSYTSSGSLIWAKKYGGNNKQISSDITLGYDNSIYVAGSDGPVNSLFDGFVLKYNQSTGQLLWSDDIPEVELKSIFVYEDNSYLVGGLSDDGALPNFYLAKYISNNQEDWQYTFGGSGENTIQGIAGDNLGNAYIAGRFNGSFTEGGLTYNSAGSSDGIVAQITPTDNCLSASSSTNYGYISKVKFNTSTSSSSTCDSYTLNQATIAEIYPGFNTSFEIGLSSCGGNFTKAFKIFIDWNQDNDFTDSGEEVYVSNILTNDTITGSFIAPGNFTTGSSTTMRIVCRNMISNDPLQDQPSDITPCGIYSFGETEDFQVSLIDYAPPAINSFSPDQGHLGDIISIDGDFFDSLAIDDVQINNTSTDFSVIDNNTILLAPRIGTTSGLITILYDNGSIISSNGIYELLCTEDFTGFEDLTLPNGWTVLNPDGATTFQIIDIGANGNSDYSAYINNYNYNNGVGQLDGFLLGNICIDQAESLLLEMDLAYTYFQDNSGTSTDSLAIVNLDNNEILWQSGGAALATADPQSTPFVPSPNEWRPVAIDISNAIQPGISSVNIAIISFNGFGNNLYLDNISMVLDGALPVDFISFEGEAKNDNSHLTWETAAEYNVNYYQLERSNDGIDFEPIAYLKSKGDSDLGHRYTYIDQTPFHGDNYYRILAMDYDGQENYSKTIVITHVIHNNSSPIEVYPNPSQGLITLANKTDEALAIKILDTKGQEVRSNITLNGSRTIVDLSHLPKATYSIHFIYKNRVYVEKVVVL